MSRRRGSIVGASKSRDVVKEILLTRTEDRTDDDIRALTLATVENKVSLLLLLLPGRTLALAVPPLRPTAVASQPWGRAYARPALACFAAALDRTALSCRGGDSYCC